MTWFDRLQRFFGKGAGRPSASIKTAPLSASADALQPARIGAAHITVGTSQSAGIERLHNEDALFVLVGSSSGEEAIPDFGLFVVADGMGGHRSGEVASALSVRTVARSLTEHTVLTLIRGNGARSNDVPLHDLMRGALEGANEAVVDQVPGGGTTLTVAVVMGDKLTIGHVGDSRAYVFNGEETRILTRDHSLVERLRELGQLTAEEAAIHPQRNVLYRAIGQGANLEVDVATHAVPREGYLLLCSDGLWGVVEEREIIRIVRSAPTPQEACDELVKAANTAGGPDNITAVLVYFPAA